MDDFIKECATGAVPTGLLLGAFYLWLKYGKSAQPPPKFDLVDDRTRNWEAHSAMEAHINEVEKRVGKVEVTVAETQADIRNHGNSIEDIKSMMTRMDSKLDQILLAKQN